MTAARNEVHKNIKGFKSRALGLGNTIYSVEFYAAAVSDAGAIPVTITCRDANNNPVSTAPYIEVGVSDTNGGAPDNAIDSAAITASGSGTELVDIGTTGIGRYRLGTDGKLDITLTDANVDKFYMFIIDNDGHRFDWSQELAFT